MSALTVVALAGLAFAAPVPKAKPRPGVVMHVSGYGLGTRLLDGESGKLLLTLKDEAPGFKRADVRLSPDGKRVAILGQPMVVTPPGVPAPPPQPAAGNQSLYLLDVGGNGDFGKPVAEGLNEGRLVWTADGDGLYFAEAVGERGNPGPHTFHRIDAAGKKIAIPELDGYYPLDVSPDGKSLLASKYGPAAQPGGRWARTDYLIDLATKKVSDIGDGTFVPRLFAASGGRLVVARPLDPKADPDGAEAFFIRDLATKKETPVPVPPEVKGDSVRLHHCLPGRDGSQWLFVWTEVVPPPAGWPARAPSAASRFTACDPDGRHGKTISRKGAASRQELIESQCYYVEWR